MNERDYPVVVMSVNDEGEEGFVAFAPDLKGCFAVGETPEEALSEIRDAIGEWIDEAVRLKREVPKPHEMNARAQKEEQRLRNLVTAQDDLIKTQDKLLKDHRREIAEIRESVTAWIESDPSEERPCYFLWGNNVPSFVATAIAQHHARRVTN